MKQFIDFYATLQAELLAKQRLASKLRRHWGVEVRDGVEVYKDSFTIWPGTESDSVRQILKIFGIPIKQIQEQSKSGLSRLYLKFVYGKIDTTSYSKEALATELETLIPLGSDREFRVTYTDTADPSKFVGWTKEQIVAYVNEHKEGIARGGLASTTVGDLTGDNVDDVIGCYIMAEDGTDFQKELLDVVVVPVPYKATQIEGEAVTSEFGSGIALHYKYRRTGYLDDNSPIVESVYNDLVNAKTSQEADSNVTNLRELLGKRQGKTDTLWYDGRIRTASVHLLKKHDYANLIMGSLDTGYDQEKKGSSLVGLIIVIIVVVVVSIATGPEGGWAAFSALSATEALTAVAIAATVTTVALTVTQYFLARSGENVTAAYVGRWVKVSGIVAMVAGITAAINSLIELAKEEAAKEIVAKAATEAATEGAVVATENVAIDTASVSITDVSLGNVYDAGVKMLGNSWNNSGWLSKMSTASKVVNPIMEWRQENLQKELTSMSDECKKQQAALAEEYDKNLHIGVEDIRMSVKPLTVANLQFEVDYQYEPTKFNIQRASFVRSGMNIIS